MVIDGSDIIFDGLTSSEESHGCVYIRLTLMCRGLGEGLLRSASSSSNCYTPLQDGLWLCIFMMVDILHERSWKLSDRSWILILTLWWG